MQLPHAARHSCRAGLAAIGAAGLMLSAVTIADPLRLVPPANAESVLPEGARPLTAQGLVNVRAFTLLLGHVRHFHPSDEVAATDWDTFAITGMRAVESATGPADLATRLQQIFGPVAPTLRIFLTGAEPPPAFAPPIAAENLFLIRWKHVGFGTGNKDSIYQSERTKEPMRIGPLGGPSQAPVGNDADHRVDLGGGVSALIPTVLYTDAAGTLPHAAKTSSTGADPKAKSTGNDRATRLAAVALTWNVMQHFYPYFDVVTTDWAGELPRALQAAATDADARAFHATLKRLVAALKDGHGGVYAPGVKQQRPGLAWDWIDGQLVITRSEVKGVARGDAVITINGIPAAVALENEEKLVSGATPQWIRHVGLLNLLAGDAGSTVQLGIEPWEARGVRRTVAVLRDRATLLDEKRTEKIAEIEPGIFYLDIDRLSDEDFQAALVRLSPAKGIVFDLRGYPNKLGVDTWLPHLIKSRVLSPQWHVPLIAAPDRKDMTFLKDDWPVEPRAPLLTAKLAFITGGGAISYAETIMTMVAHYKLADIVGGPTAGTNGNINPFVVPGGYFIVWTGMKVLRHDGSTYHGVGVQPTIPAARTRAGVAAGRDELIERAVRAVKGE